MRLHQTEGLKRFKLQAVKSHDNMQLIQTIQGTSPQQMDLLSLQHELHPEEMKTQDTLLVVTTNPCIVPARSLYSTITSKDLAFLRFPRQDAQS